MSWDPYSWPGRLYHSDVDRTKAEATLHEQEVGTFIIRDSSNQSGFSLSVRQPDENEECVIRHYLIYDYSEQGQGYRIGEQTFPNMESLLNFYKTHYLGETHLIRPASRHLQRVVAKFNFPGAQDCDLPFKKGEILSVLQKKDENWWRAQNEFERIGLIPANFVEEMCNGSEEKTLEVCLRQSAVVSSAEEGVQFRDSNSSSGSAVDDSQSPNNIPSPNRKLPAYATVINDRNPNAYDKSNLRLRIGDIIKVIKTNANGTWEGILNGKTGKFPFTYIEWINEPCD